MLLQHTSSFTRPDLQCVTLLRFLCTLQTFPYRVKEDSGLIDYDQLEANAALYRPKLIVAGASAYTRHYDYGRMRQIADKHNAWLLSDMAHISGLVAAGTYHFQQPGSHHWPCQELSRCSGSLFVHLLAQQCPLTP